MIFLIIIQPFMVNAIENNQNPSKIFLSAKPSRIISQHYTLLDAKLTGKNINGYEPLSNQLVQFYIFVNDNWEILGESITDDEGHAKLTIFIELPENKYNIKAEFLGNLLYLESYDEKMINVLEETHDIILSEDQFEVPWGDIINLSASILNPAGNPIPNRAVNFSVYFDLPDYSGWLTLPTNFSIYEDEESNIQIDYEYNLKTDKDGFAEIPYSPLPFPGLYDIKVSYKGGKSNGIGEKIFWNALKVTKRTSNISSDLTFSGFYGDPVTLSASLFDHSNVMMKDKDVNIYLKEFDSWNLIGSVNTGNTGHILFEFTQNLNPGTYPIKFEFLGDALYTPITSEGQLEIEKEITVINDHYINIKVSYSDLININTYITDDEGNPLSNKEIEFYVSYDLINYILLDVAITDSNGYANVDYLANEMPGTYSIYLRFNGDEYYQSSQIYGSLIIKKELTRIFVEDIEYHGPSIPVTFVATIQEDDGPPITGVLLDFFLHSGSDELYIGNAISDFEGIASLTTTIEIDETEIYTIFAKYLGNEIYFPGIGHDSILVPPKNANIDISAEQLSSGIIDIDILIIDEDNNPVPYITIDILITNSEINDKLTVTTDAIGIATTSFDPQEFVGTLYLTASSSSSVYNVNTEVISIKTASGLGITIDKWLIFAGEETLAELGVIAGSIGIITGAILGSACFFAWIEKGDSWWGSIWAAVVFAAGIAIGVGTIILDFFFSVDYNQLASLIGGVIGRLGDSNQVEIYSIDSTNPDYLPVSEVSNVLTDEILNDPLANDVALIILGTQYKDAVKNWFLADPNRKNKLYFTLLNYDNSFVDKDVFQHHSTPGIEGTVIAFLSPQVFTSRNTWTLNFFDAMLVGNDLIDAYAEGNAEYNREGLAFAMAFMAGIIVAFLPFIVSALIVGGLAFFLYLLYFYPGGPQLYLG